MGNYENVILIITYYYIEIKTVKAINLVLNYVIVNIYNKSQFTFNENQAINYAYFQNLQNKDF